MSAPRFEELLAEARRLDAEAIHMGEEGAHGRTLRARAAALRVEAIGERVYPVLVCSACYRLTGWTSARGRCDACLRHAAARAEESSGSWPSRLVPSYPKPSSAPPAPLGARLAARLGHRRALDQAVVRTWMAHVEPDETGPVDPEVGYEIEVAVRDEVERIDASGMLVRFTTLTHRFGGGGWERLSSTRVGRSQLPLPAEFAADLPIAALVEAWSDYQQALAAIGRRSWRAELDAREAREAERAGEATSAQAVRDQRHTSDLLHE
jgi:hypothetical protein